MAHNAEGAASFTLATVGYESTTVPAFLDALRAAGVTLLVDVRAVASSRRPGFAKSRLSANAQSVGIAYEHLRSLGTPVDGRAAARSGRPNEMRRIYLEHLQTPEAQDGLERLATLVRSGERVAILCFERDPSHCHRAIIAERLSALMTLRVTHLRPELEE